MKFVASFKYNDIKITSHAQERAAERTDIETLDELCQAAEKSITEGIDALADPTLRELVYAYAKRHNNSGMYAYKGYVYVFKDDALVTIIPIGWLASLTKDGHIE